MIINPGSTSTKLAYFEDEDKLFETSVFHDAPFLASLGKVSNQFEYRLRLIKEFIDENEELRRQIRRTGVRVP